MTSSPWLSKEDAIFSCGSKMLGLALYSVIGLIPYQWSHIVLRRIREPFVSGDWIISRNECNKLPWLYVESSIGPTK
jgi:hypothetical protein